MIKMQLCIDQGRPSHPKFYTFLNCTFRYKIFLIFKRKKKILLLPKEIFLVQIIQKIKCSLRLFIVRYFILILFPFIYILLMKRHKTYLGFNF